MKSAGGLGTVLYPIKHDADPYLTEKGVSIAQRNGSKLKEAKIPFDIVFSSVMVRTMQTAYHIFVKNGVSEKIYLAPFISETPMSFSGVKLAENIPLPRRKQIEKLGRLDGSNLLDSLDWSLVGGANGDNEKCLPPNGNNFLAWLVEQDIMKELEEELDPERDTLNVAVVTHSNFLKGDLIKLGYKPDNVDIWLANLHRMEAGPNEDPILTVTDIESWYEESLEQQKQEIMKGIDYNKGRNEKKKKKYEGKIDAHQQLIGDLTNGDENTSIEDKKALKQLEKSKKKIEKYNAKLEKKAQKYGGRIDDLEKRKQDVTNRADLDIEAANSSS